MFDISKVVKVYSGRKGCACGCRGKYSYASQFSGARPSYYDAHEGISDRSVKTIVAKVDKMIRDPNSDVKGVMIRDGFFAVDMANDRTYTVYFA